MYNWSVDTRRLKKDKKQYAIWMLEQMINYGTGGKKIPKEALKKYWKHLNIDPYKARFLRRFL